MISQSIPNNRLCGKLTVKRHRHILMVGLFLAAITGVIGCENNGGLDSVQYLERAKDHYDTGQLAPAVIELKNALQKQPDNVEARWLLGSIYVKLGDGQSAEKELKRALELGLAPEVAAISLAKSALLQGKYSELLENDIPQQNLPKPDQALLWALRGHAQMGLGDLDSAAESYDTSLSINDTEPEAGLGIARIAAASGNFDDARNQLDTILQTHTDFVSALLLLGTIESIEDNAQAAEKTYTKVIELQPGNLAARTNRALVRIALAEFEGAANDINTAEKIDPRNPGVAFIRGLLAFQQQNYQEAGGYFQRAENQRYVPALFYGALNHYALGNLTLAEANLERVLHASPSSVVASKWLAFVRLKSGNPRGAKLALQPVIERTPDDSEALDLMASAAIAMGQTASGTEHLRKVTLVQPESGTAYMKLGLNLLAEGKREQASLAIEKAMELDPELHNAEFALIADLLKSQEYQAALEAAEQLREKRPEDPIPLNLIGVATMHMGDEDRATASFEAALELDPAYAPAAHNLARIALSKGDKEMARNYYELILENDPGQLHTLLALAELEGRDGNLEKAKSTLERAMRQNPQAEQPKILLARYYNRTGQASRVLGLLPNFSQNLPSNPDLLIEYGQAQLSAGLHNKAVETFEALVDLIPESAGAHYSLAKAYAGVGDLSSMRRELDVALKADPDHFLSKLAWVRLLQLENKLDEAAEQLEELKTSQPDNPEILAQEGSLALAQNRPNDAVTAYRAVLEQSPSSRWLVALAQAEWRAEGPDAAIDSLRAWLVLHPTETSVRLALADAYLAQDRIPEAKSEYLKALEHDPDNILALNNAAWFFRADNPIQALEYAERALKLAPEAPDVQDTLGVLLLEQGETARSLNLLRSASEATNNLTTRYHLARALVVSGHQEEARRLLDELLSDESPEFPEKQEAKTLLLQLDTPPSSD